MGIISGFAGSAEPAMVAPPSAATRDWHATVRDFAAEHFKNIQILKDRPASSVIDTMRAFNMSLGVNCEFCHVQGNFASDDKPKKVTARKMLTMTAAINQQNFNGNMQVRCYTCHQGHEEPQARPSF